MSVKIADLGVVTELSDTDSFIVETSSSGTKRISSDILRKKIMNPSGSSSTITAVTKTNKMIIVDESTGEIKVISTEDFLESSVSFNDILSTSMGAAAAYHNSKYRGKEITDLNKMYANIRNGTFDDIFPGDYFNAHIVGDGIDYNGPVLVADCNTYINRGDTPITDNHIVVTPYIPLTSAYMNSTNITTNGYCGTHVYNNVIPKIDTALTNFFGDHLMTHRDLLSYKSSDTVASGAGAGWQGASIDWKWVDVKSVLMSIAEVIGNNTGCSSIYDIGMANSQFALFRMNPTLINANRNWYWTKCVANATYFVSFGGYGDVYGSYASYVGGVRPRFLIKG